MNNVLDSMYTGNIKDAQAEPVNNTDKPLDGATDKPALQGGDSVIKSIAGKQDGYKDPNINQPIGEPDYASMIANNSGNDLKPGTTRGNFTYNSAEDYSTNPELITQDVLNGKVTDPYSWQSYNTMDDQYKATDDSDYSWNKIAGQRAQSIYEQEEGQVLADYAKSMQEIKAAGAQAMEEFFAAAYEGAQTADKMGWSGGQLDSQATAIKFLQAQESAKMLNKFELQEYGFESQLSVARMYAQAKKDELAYEIYKDEYNKAIQQAETTGYYVSPAAKEMFLQIDAADKIANDPTATEDQKKRAAQAKSAAYAYFDKYHFEKDPETGDYIGIKTLSLLSHEENVRHSKEMEKLQDEANDAAWANYNLSYDQFQWQKNQQAARDDNGRWSTHGGIEFDGKTLPNCYFDSSTGAWTSTGAPEIVYNNGNYYMKSTKGGQSQYFIYSPGNTKNNDNLTGRWYPTTKAPTTGYSKVTPTHNESVRASNNTGDTGNGDGEEGK